MQDTEQLLGLIFTSIGFLIAFPVWLIIFLRWKFRNRPDALKTEAFVVKNKEKYSSGRTNYQPTVEFFDATGTKQQFTSKLSTYPARVQTNTYTDIYYIRGNPKKVQLSGGKTLRIFTIITSILGLAFLIPGIMLLSGLGKYL